MHPARQWQQQPVTTGIAFGSGVLGAVGCIVGLVRGLMVYAPTAWAATFEVGIPSAVLGVILGATVGLVAQISRRLRS